MLKVSQEFSCHKNCEEEMGGNVLGVVGSPKESCFLTKGGILRRPLKADAQLLTHIRCETTEPTSR